MGRVRRRDLGPRRRYRRVERRLRDARITLDQHVTAAQQGNQGEADLVMLADDHAFDVGENPVAGLLDLAHRPLSWVWRMDWRRNGRDRLTTQPAVGRVVGR